MAGIDSPRTRYIALGVAALFLVCIGSVAYANRASLASLFSGGEAFELSDGRVVVYDGAAFSPARLVVAQGDVVTFKNESARDIWPASDSHPVHTIYPAFDPKRPIPPGGSWEFTFGNPGIWEYHDHLASDERGEIVVLDSRGAAVKARCDDADARTPACFERRLTDALERDGLDAALDEMARLYEQEPKFRESCHGSTHTLGEAAYRLYEKGAEIALTAKTSYCGYGFYHGFMEAMLRSTGDVRQARDFCAHAGEMLADDARSAEGACYHGIGHGAVDGADPRDWEDPKRLVAPGLALCERVDPSEPNYFRCASGAFNSLALLYVANSYGLRLASADLYGVCSLWEEDRTRLPCYYEMNMPVLRQSGGDLAAAIKQVERISDRDAAHAAMRGLADVAGVKMMSAPQGLSATRSACLSARGDLALPCLQGAVGGIFEGGATREEHTTAFAFCTDPSLTAAQHKECMRSAFSAAQWFYPKEVHRAVCAHVEPSLREQCLDPRPEQ